VSLRVVLFTRSGRPSGAQMAWRLFESGKPPVAIVAERRGKMGEGKKEGLLFYLWKLGPTFLWKRLREGFRIQSHFYLRKLLGFRFRSPVYLSLEEWMLDHPEVPVFRVEDHNGPDVQALLRRLKPDVGILTNTRRIKNEILEIPRQGFLNLHLSALPHYAGLDSIFWALYHGEREIGVTVHFAASEIDRGDIVLQKKIPVSPLDNEESLYEKALWLGTHLVIVALKQLEEGTIERKAQETSRENYFSWPSAQERRIFEERRKQEKRTIPSSSERPAVLHLITRMTRGGAQENTLLTALGLKKRGYPVTLATGLGWGAEGEILSQALEAGLEVVLLPELVRDLHPWKDGAVLLRLRSWLAKQHYAIIHTHTSKAGFLGRLAAHLARVPIVVHTPHGHVFHSYFRPWTERFFLALERKAAEWSERLIALTNRDLHEHLELKVGRPDQWTTIPSGVDEKGFQARRPREEILQSLGIPAGRRVVGFIGRLAPVKGAIHLIEALSRIREAVSNTHCLLVGDGEERPALEKRVEQLGLREWVTFAGHREGVADFLSVLDVLVVPSLNEGMGRVIVEAGFLAKPVVATDVGGIPDLIEDGVSGLLVERRRPPALAEAVKRILKDSALAEKLGRSLQAKVLDGFTADQMVEKIEHLYQELLTEKGLFFQEKEVPVEDSSFR